ncbi:MAG: hypothetical protein AB1571_00930 [Nanoarchaeota archaeon]
METKQINLKLPANLLSVAERYVQEFGFRNIQDLAIESIREKIFEKNEYDETFSEDEIKLIDELIKTSIEKKKIISETELMKVLG